MNLRGFLVGRGFLRPALCAVLSLSGSLLAQDIIENPGKPAGVNAGRTLKLEEIWRITDEGGAFYFKYPNRLRIAPDGMIFLQDNEALLEFSADGKFIRNFFKKGEGPGEMSSSFSYQIDGPELMIFDWELNRLWRMDREGKYLGEIPFNKKIRRSFLGIYRNEMIFFREDAPIAKNGIPGFVDFPNMIMLVAKDGRTETDIKPFFFRRYQVSPGRGGMNWGNSIKTMSEDGRFVYGFHGRNYLVEVMDLEQKNIVRRFRRDFPRIPEPETKEAREWREGLKFPKPEYKSAIINLIPGGTRLWAVTSIEDSGQGRLCDVFDAEGRYVDCFYLGPGRTLLRTAGEAIFVLEANKDETFRLVKYRIVG